MQVWLNKNHTRPQVFGAVVVKAGSKDCPNTGIAHYFEHILFKGTDKIGTADYQSENLGLTPSQQNTMNWAARKMLCAAR